MAAAGEDLCPSGEHPLHGKNHATVRRCQHSSRTRLLIWGRQLSAQLSPTQQVPSHCPAPKLNARPREEGLSGFKNPPRRLHGGAAWSSVVVLGGCRDGSRGGREVGGGHVQHGKPALQLPWREKFTWKVGLEHVARDLPLMPRVYILFGEAWKILNR